MILTFECECGNRLGTDVKNPSVRCMRCDKRDWTQIEYFDCKPVDPPPPEEEKSLTSVSKKKRVRRRAT